jgi:hypothetical protein
MEQTTRAKAVKKLETDLKEEKAHAIVRSVLLA